MAENSKIEWTDHTFNPWVGCTKVGPGCDHCYAESWAKRTGAPGLWNGERRRTSAANWRAPLKWNREAEAEGVRRRVFCASLADVFDNEVPQEWRDDLWELIRRTPNLDWLLLTKRIGNALKLVDAGVFRALPNVWLGATVVNQEEADRDILKLLAVPARVRFLSMEPLLAPVDLTRIGPKRINALGRGSWLHWVIAGGESGPKARDFDVQWGEDIVEQCRSAEVPVFVKQLGSNPVCEHQHMPIPMVLKDKKGGDMAEWPEDLRVREFPA